MTITFEQIKETITDGHINWRDLLDEGQQKEVEFSKVYAYSYAHGTEGHNAKLIIAKQADMLDALVTEIARRDEHDADMNHEAKERDRD